MRYKHKLAKSLFAQARKISFIEDLNENIVYFTDVLISNGYRESFIKKWSKNVNDEPKTFGMERKEVFLQMPIKIETKLFN